MSRLVVRSPTAPALVAQRLSELLQCFPSAAMGGVQWHTLARKYEERHGARLDLAALGQGSPLAAATALLWDVLRIVDSEDTDNPVVAVEDSIALSPQPGASASWPSLYRVLCQVAEKFGAVETREGVNGEIVHGILVSQLKPLLQSHWHCDFNESSLGYLTEEGTPVRFKKMKHLLQALLRWREQRLAWKATINMAWTALDAALEPCLELVPSTNHNDLVLRCISMRPVSKDLQRLATPAFHDQRSIPQPCSESSCSLEDTLSEDTASTIGSATELEQELALLRTENAKLRGELLQRLAPGPVAQAECVPIWARHEPELFDDPFEPPPQADRSHSWCTPMTTSRSSTAVPRDCGFSPGTLTPLSSGTSSSSQGASGSATPAVFGPGQQVCAFVPVCFTMVDRMQIPSGVVQQARAIFERQTVIPSFFVRQ